MKQNSGLFFMYGGFLFLMGLLGFLSNPGGAKTALLSGSLFGGLSIVLGCLALREWGMVRRLGLGLTLLLGAVFSWRALASWTAVSGGQSEKLVAAMLISAMLVVTIVVFAVLLRRDRRPDQPSPALQS